MFRRAEIIEHGVRAENLNDRAIYQAERGHIGRAVMLEERADLQRAEMIGAAVRPHPYPMYGPGAGIVAAETAGVVAGAVVAGEVAAHQRQREIREAEFAYAATRPVYPPNVYVEPVGAYPAGAGYGGAYPPVGGAVYQPGAAYPPTYPPGTVYPRTYPY